MDWWETLNDPILTDLIQQAAAANPDGRQSASRVREACFQRRQT